jgi:hypothetical protein
MWGESISISPGIALAAILGGGGHRLEHNF